MFFSLFCISLSMAMPQPKLKDLLSEDGWKTFKTIKDKEVGTITVQEKDIKGFPCFRAFAKTHIAVSVFAPLAQDIPSSLDWSSSGLKESITLHQTKEYIDYYQYLSIPFLSDRHWFLRAKLASSPQEFLFTWKRLPQDKHVSFAAKKRKQYPSAVEPPINIGQWKFTAIEQQTKVQYSICTHPGGSVPKQLRSVGTVRTLPTNIKEMIIEGKKRAQ